MKKIGLICTAILMCGGLVACGNQSSKAKSSTSKISSLKKENSKLKNHKSQNEKKEDSKDRSSSSSSSNQTNTTQQQNKSQQTYISKSQGEINRERGYDPNGNPLLPGQDHAAGSNPDGSPDAWVQGQIDWAKQNGYLNPDGSETQKGIEADQEVEQDSQPGMP